MDVFCYLVCILLLVIHCLQEFSYNKRKKEDNEMKDYFGYQGKNCVVTGASSGMGKATAELLVELEANVYALDWNECDVKGIKKYVRVDLSKKDSIDEAMKELPEKIDSYFGIAGISGAKNDFMTTVSVDFISNKYICEMYLKKRMSRGGSIAFMTSTGGNGWEREDNKSVYLPSIEANGWEATVEAITKTGLNYLPGTLGYPYSKLAMNYYTVYLQKKMTAKGIRVNAVLPGSTKTGMKDEFEKMAGGAEHLLSHCGYAGRLAESREMAEPIVFLNSQMASYASGVLMEVDYGNTAEEKAGIRPVEQVISLQGILKMMTEKMKQ